MKPDGTTATDGLAKCGWGVLCHYLVPPETSAAAWNRQVDAFDVSGLAQQLQEAGAGYFMLTLGQGSGHYCAPNETYDGMVGIEPSKLSKRDLVGDISMALQAHGIEMLVYITSDGPWGDPVAREKMGLTTHWNDYSPEEDVAASETMKATFRLPEFQQKWEDICRDWALRFGDKVRGFWVDGTYFKEHRFPEGRPPNLKTLAGALRSGNPDAILAFNSGVRIPIVHDTEHEDFTAGEQSRALPACTGAHVRDARTGHEALCHILTHLGDRWGHQSKAQPRFPDELVGGYTRHVLSKGAVLTWDAPIEPGGRIVDAYFRQLKCIGTRLKLET